VCGWIRAEDQPVCGRLALQLVEHHPRLDAGDTGLRVDAQHAVQVFREFDDDGNVAALSREARASTARQDRRAVPAAHLHGCDDVVDVARDHDADWDLAIVRAIGRVHGASARIEPHLPTDDPPQITGERGVPLGH